MFRRVFCIYFQTGIYLNEIFFKACLGESQYLCRQRQKNIISLKVIESFDLLNTVKEP
jgi:hypothetical protein